MVFNATIRGDKSQDHTGAGRGGRSQQLSAEVFRAASLMLSVSSTEKLIIIIKTNKPPKNTNNKK